jgi:hypothetical protein
VRTGPKASSWSTRLTRGRVAVLGLGLAGIVTLFQTGVAQAASTTVTVPMAEMRDLSISVAPNVTVLPASGAPVTWSFLVTDTGSDAITALSITNVIDPQALGSDTAEDFIAPSANTDVLAAPISCPVSSLAPGAATTCTASEVVDATDVAQGGLSDAAFASGTASGGATVASHVAEGSLHGAPVPTTTAAPAPAVAPTVVVHRVTTRAHFPWGLVAAILAVLGMFLAYLGARIRRERNVRRAAELDRRQRWDERTEAYHVTMAEWGAYETDLLRSWQFPLIGDVSDPRCCAFLAAQQQAALAKRDVYPAVPALVEQFAAATDEMAAAWDVLEAAAKRIKLENIPAPFRAKINLAIELLGKGLHPSATPAERRLFVDRATIEAAEAINAMYLRVPERAVRTIEAMDIPALAAAGA